MDTGSPPAPPKVAIEKADLDLFAAKRFLGVTEYEHYTLKDGLLWRECGTINLKKNSASTASKGRPSNLQIRQKRLESLKGEEQRPLIQALNALATETSSQELKKLPPAESLRSMNEGGLFELRSSSKDIELITAVDAVSEPKNRALELIKSAFAKVRRVGPVICDAETFFGVGRE